MSGRQRRAGEWPAWIDDVLAYGPIAELEPGWQAAVGDAITRVLDQRGGSVEPATCDRCGSLLTLSCTIRGCGVELPPGVRAVAGEIVMQLKAVREFLLGGGETETPPEGNE